MVIEVMTRCVMHHLRNFPPIPHLPIAGRLRYPHYPCGDYSCDDYSWANLGRLRCERAAAMV